MKCPVCGHDERKKARSLPQHRRYFAIINAAYSQWPESYLDFQPRSSEHLRKWLQVEAGYGVGVDTTLSFPKSRHAEAKAFVQAIVDLVRIAYKEDIFPRINRHTGQIRFYASKSISFCELPHLEACRLFDAVSEIVTAVIGVPAEKLLKENAA